MREKSDEERRIRSIQLRGRKCPVVRDCCQLDIRADKRCHLIAERLVQMFRDFLFQRPCVGTRLENHIPAGDESLHVRKAKLFESLSQASIFTTCPPTLIARRNATYRGIAYFLRRSAHPNANETAGPNDCGSSRLRHQMGRVPELRRVALALGPVHREPNPVADGAAHARHRAVLPCPDLRAAERPRCNQNLPRACAQCRGR